MNIIILGEPYWIKKGEKPLHKYPYLDDLRDSFASYREHLNKEIFDAKLKKDDLINRVQTLINSNGDKLKLDLKKEVQEFVKVLMKALYFKERQQDLFITKLKRKHHITSNT